MPRSASMSLNSAREIAEEGRKSRPGILEGCRRNGPAGEVGRLLRLELHRKVDGADHEVQMPVRRRTMERAGLGLDSDTQVLALRFGIDCFPPLAITVEAPRDGKPLVAADGASCRSRASTVEDIDARKQSKRVQHARRGHGIAFTDENDFPLRACDKPPEPDGTGNRELDLGRDGAIGDKGGDSIVATGRHPERRQCLPAPATNAIEYDPSTVNDFLVGYAKHVEPDDAQ